MIKLNSNTTRVGIGILLTSAGAYFSGHIGLMEAILGALTSLVAILAKDEKSIATVPTADVNIPEGKPLTVEEALRQRRK